MKCECGNEFEGNFCPVCGRPAAATTVQTQAPTQQPIQQSVQQPAANGDGTKSSWLSKLEYFLNLRFRLCAGCVVSAVFALFTGYIFTALAFGAAAVFVSPKWNEKHPTKRKKYIILTVVLLVTGLVFATTQTSLQDQTHYDDYSDSSQGYETSADGNYTSSQSADEDDTFYNGWQISFISTHIEHDNIFDDENIYVTVKIKNISGHKKQYSASSIFEMNNNGVYEDPVILSDYDYTDIADGGSFTTELKFSYPGGANTDYDYIVLNVGDEHWYFGDAM